MTFDSANRLVDDIYGCITGSAPGGVGSIRIDRSETLGFVSSLRATKEGGVMNIIVNIHVFGVLMLKVVYEVMTTRWVTILRTLFAGVALRTSTAIMGDPIGKA